MYDILSIINVKNLSKVNFVNIYRGGVKERVVSSFFGVHFLIFNNAIKQKLFELVYRRAFFVVPKIQMVGQCHRRLPLLYRKKQVLRAVFIRRIQNSSNHCNQTYQTTKFNSTHYTYGTRSFILIRFEKVENKFFVVLG